jgi:hypothetical protein
VKIVDKKRFQLEFFNQFIEEKNLKDKWNSFKDENTFELAKIFRNQAGIKESYNQFLIDTLGINPTPEDFDQNQPDLTATEVNILLQSQDGRDKLRKTGLLKDEQDLKAQI